MSEGQPVQRRMSVSDRMKMLKQAQEDANNSSTKSPERSSSGKAAANYQNAANKDIGHPDVKARIGSVKHKFQTLMDYEMAHKLQQEEYGAIKTRNTTHSNIRKGDVKVARKEDIVEQREFEKLKQEQLVLEGFDHNVSIEIQTKEQQERLDQLREKARLERIDAEMASEQTELEAAKARLVLEERARVARDEAIATQLQKQELEGRRQDVAAKGQLEEVAKFDETYASTLVKIESEEAQRRMQSQGDASTFVTQSTDPDFVKQQHQEMAKLKQKSSGRVEEEDEEEEYEDEDEDEDKEEEEDEDVDEMTKKFKQSLSPEFLKQQEEALAKLNEQHRSKQKEEETDSDDSEFDI